jgi:NTP pyrophosphatase (non-canonical NTP hydrolase)
MGFNEYQDKAETFATYDNVFYPYASLMIETAELVDIFVKPLLRGDVKTIIREEVIAEAGDVLWNLAVLLKKNNVKLEEVALYNIEKLTGRLARGTIRGDGGNR